MAEQRTGCSHTELGASGFLFQTGEGAMSGMLQD